MLVVSYNLHTWYNIAHHRSAQHGTALPIATTLENRPAPYSIVNRPWLQTRLILARQPADVVAHLRCSYLSHAYKRLIDLCGGCNNKATPRSAQPSPPSPLNSHVFSRRSFPDSRLVSSDPSSLSSSKNRHLSPLILTPLHSMFDLIKTIAHPNATYSEY